MSPRRFNFHAPAAHEVAADAFVMLPVAGLPAMSPEQVAAMKEIYERALTEARKVVQPSILERDLLGVWN